LENSKQKLEQSKKADLEKLEQSLSNSISQAQSLVNNILLKVDEIYGITDENKHKNDAFESYLSAKNTALKEKIKTEFRILFSTDVKDWSSYLKQVDDFVNLVKDSIKASVSTTRLP
jgi:hypothetical protein